MATEKKSATKTTENKSTPLSASAAKTKAKASKPVAEKIEVQAETAVAATAAVKASEQAETKVNVKEVIPEENVQAAKAEEAKSQTAAAFEEKEVAPKAYAAYKQVKEVYVETQALNLLRRKIFQYKEIDAKFLKKVEEENAFKMERTYIPVVRATANVRYLWKTKGEGEVLTHSEIKKTDRLFSNAGELDALNYSAENVIADKERPIEKLYKQEAYTFKKATKNFKKAVKSARPAKNAKTETRGAQYEIIYVPVLKATCRYEGEDYVGYVNLVNGACVSDYKISERLQTAVDKTLAKTRAVRGNLISSLLFVLTLCGLAVIKAMYPEFNSWNFNIGWSAIGLLAIATVPLLGIAFTMTYKSKRMKEKTVKTGSMPTANGAKIAMVIGWLACIGAVVLFAYGALLV